MIKLYGSKFSLYTGKVRSYLIQKGIPFEEITSTLKVYKNFIIPRTGVRYVPVIQTDNDEVIQDTSDIIDCLELAYPENSIYPVTSKQKLVSLLLEVYGDEWLVIPAMHYRWNYPRLNGRFINGEFGRLVMPRAPKLIQRFLGKKLGRKFNAFVPGLGISEKNIAVIERSYEQLLRDLNAHFAQHDYLLGGKPTIGDFGFIGPLYAHLYRDPAPRALMQKVAPNVCAWVERMNKPNLSKVDLPSDDTVPATLTPILQRMAKEHLPVLNDTNRLLAEWRKANPMADEVDRFIGKHDFKIDGVSGQRLVLPYSLWMLQRPMSVYRSLENTDEIDGYFRSIGFTEFQQIELHNPLKRQNNKLMFVSDEPIIQPNKPRIK